MVLIFLPAEFYRYFSEFFCFEVDFSANPLYIKCVVRTLQIALYHTRPATRGLWLLFRHSFASSVSVSHPPRCKGIVTRSCDSSWRTDSYHTRPRGFRMDQMDQVDRMDKKQTPKECFIGNTSCLLHKRSDFIARLALLLHIFPRPASRGLWLWVFHLAVPSI